MLDLNFDQIATRDWIRNPVDCYPESPQADPDCDRCKGHGILDDGEYGFVPANCPCVISRIISSYFECGVGI